MRRVAIAMLALSVGCHGDDNSASEAGVGGDRTGCEEPGSHSLVLDAHSCECEDGFDWCSDALDDFNCCAIAGDSDTGDTGDTGDDPPSLVCDEAHVEQLACIDGPSDDPGDSAIWACNGARWVEAPGYSKFACMAAGFAFAYGCVPGTPDPEFLCGYGPGSECDPLTFGGVCTDEDIIDTCVWNRRTVDRCSRLCAELEVFGPGFESGACVQADPEQPAICVCN